MEERYSQQTILPTHIMVKNLSLSMYCFSVPLIEMILKLGVIFFLIQVLLVNLSVSFTLRGLSLSHSPLAKSSLDLLKNQNFHNAPNGFKRKRRCLSTALSLLWPQVVGPVEQGVIEENSYQEVPKTLLEYRLDLIRRKAQQEEETRLIVRDYLKKLAEAEDELYDLTSYENTLASNYPY